jgi:hypothetical protein
MAERKPAHDLKMEAEHPDLVSVSGDCLNELAGRQCDHIDHDWPRIDHAETFKSMGKSLPLAIVGHVYDCDSTMFDDWLRKTDELGLEFYVSGESSYHENAIMILFFKKPLIQPVLAELS